MEKANTNKGKNRKVELEKDEPRKKDNDPLVQVDKHGDPVSNFISNFKRQFQKAAGLFGRKSPAPPQRSAEPSDIIGATKTVFCSNDKSSSEGQPLGQSKKKALKTDRSNKVKSDDIRKPKKPKLRL
ncbi:hypothetical protein [Sphingobacterium hotanense]|uniref:hypothetical protein n=1 Tax=Sphingobacterium TaxID=28453 RepID=UPI0021A82ECC|nr:hypothetical protein [Sphingobacterium hotanense]MCT1523654.1 hypothetical protein [Sphingobacterium hotanense]